MFSIQDGLPNTVRRHSLATASSMAILLVGSSAAHAQNAAPTDVETVVVSSSRIMNSGFDAPTPTTVIGAQDIQRQANDNIFTTIAQLPSLMGNTGTTVGTGGSSNGNSGLSTLNIRGIGTSRNLIMIDGERVVPSASFGISDVSQFPQMLIQRVDVVTGGASASWGSDAVSGVVNFILDKKFEGFKMNVLGGITTYADDGTGQFQMAAGSSFAGGRGHIETSIELTSEAGVNSVIGPRTWYRNPESVQYGLAATPAGMPQFNNVFNAKDYQFTTGGLITNGPLQGTAFGANGTPYKFAYGVGPVNGLPATPSGLASGAVNNCFGSYCVGGDTSGEENGYGSMVSRLARGNFYGRVSYDVTPDINVFATAMWGEVFSEAKPTHAFYKNANLSVGCDNAFLPASIAASCATYAAQAGSPYAPTSAYPNGVMQFGVQNSVLTDVEIAFNRTLRRFVLGSDGTFNLFNTDWTYTAYAEDGRTDYSNKGYNLIITPYYNAAIDAVRDPVTGVVQCRSAAARSIGCVPLNVIGTGGVSQSAQEFVQGTGNSGASGTPTSGKFAWSNTNQRQDVFDVAVSGEPLENWAGKISVATGFQYREEAFQAFTDCTSQGNCGGNPVLNAIGGNWYAGNYQPARGNFHESEMFLETLIPLLDSQQLGKVNFNIAGRETKYSIKAGWISTWKLGFTWDTPMEGLRFRGLQSRDVRAPNLSELYAGPRVTNGQLTDNFPPYAGQTFTVQSPITSNPNLKVESGQTTEFGLVYTPDWIPGLNSSITYYRVGVKNIIGSISQQQQEDLCFAGNQLQCSFIIRDPITGIFARQTLPNINLASVITDGVDYEVSYRFAADDVINWMDGEVTLRALATNVSKYITNPGLVGSIPLESAGNNSGNIPHWKVFFTQSYDTDRWGLVLNERWFSDGVTNISWIQCSAGTCPAPTVNHPTTNNDFMPGELYFDLGGHYSVSASTEVYFKIDNLTNQNPGNAVAWSNSPQGPLTNPALYDTLGRFYHVGIRIAD